MTPSLSPEQQLQERMKLVPLGPWVYNARINAIPSIPAWFSDPFPVEQIAMAQDGPGENGDDIRELLNAIQQVESLCAPDFPDYQYHFDNRRMVRWECTAGCDMKHRVKEQRVKEQRENGGHCREHTIVTIDDPTLETVPFGATVPDENGNTRLCVRPWVEHMVIDGYPLEFRVFFGPDGFQGVSNYWPQRPLPEGPRIRGLADLAMNLALRMYNAQPELRVVGCTMDFLVPHPLKWAYPRIDCPPSDILFLEGGPPHVPGEMVSAHSCCFPPGQVSGIVFAALPGAPAR
jgi:hypothetical protein